MSRFLNVLVAADFSEGSKHAFAAACSLARGGETRLTVLNVMGPGPLADERHGVALDHLRAAYVPDRPVNAEYLARAGDAAETTLRVAEERGCDLLVLGTHGRTGLERLFAGSVAETVLRRARCPVLVAHAPAPEPDAPAPSSGPEACSAPPVRTILHATDFSGCAGVALRVARALACDQGARLVVVHAIPTVDVPHLKGPALLQDPEACREALGGLAEIVDGADLKYPVTTRLAFGEPADVILRAAGETRCDLLVLGTHGRTGLARLLTGSVAEEVLRHARRPVLLAGSCAAALAPGGRDAPGPVAGLRGGASPAASRTGS